MTKLIAILPAYNEEAVISNTVREWLDTLDGTGVDYRLRVRDDGSRDRTADIVDAIDHPHLELVRSENRGHGPTILAEYRRAAEEAEWIFQTDSDGELPATAFPDFWEAREGADLVLGHRQNRDGPWVRKLITTTLRFLLRVCFPPGVKDGNCPYRLHRAEAFREVFKKIPVDTFAPNALLSGHAARHLRVKQLPVPHTPRQTGEVSIQGARLLKAAAKSARQLIAFRAKPERGIHSASPRVDAE